MPHQQGLPEQRPGRRHLLGVGLVSVTGSALLALAMLAGPGTGDLNFIQGRTQFGEWQSVPVGLVARQFDAQPGEAFRIEVRWPAANGTFELQVWSGQLPPDRDLDDAEHVLTAPRVGPTRAQGHQRIKVPPQGNAVWFRIRPHGQPEQMIEFRVERDKAH